MSALSLEFSDYDDARAARLGGSVAVIYGCNVRPLNASEADALKKRQADYTHQMGRPKEVVEFDALSVRAVLKSRGITVRAADMALGFSLDACLGRKRITPRKLYQLNEWLGSDLWSGKEPPATAEFDGAALRQDIKARGISIASVAREIGRTPGSLASYLSRGRMSKPLYEDVCRFVSSLPVVRSTP